MVKICEPETGRSLKSKDKLGSFEDLKLCFHIAHVGNGSRSLWDLIDCQEGSREFSIL
jgi:hypothetical protein